MVVPVRPTLFIFCSTDSDAVLAHLFIDLVHGRHQLGVAQGVTEKRRLLEIFRANVA